MPSASWAQLAGVITIPRYWVAPTSTGHLRRCSRIAASMPTCVSISTVAGCSLDGGGNVGLVTPDVFKASTRAILQKWGSAVSFKKLPFQKNREVAAVRIAVKRTNKTAQK